MSERGMLNLLTERYNSERRGAIADRWVRAEQVRSSQNMGRTRITVADFIAIDKYSSTQAMHGHEVKVSRSDWLTELKDLTKAEEIKRYCDYWWLVVSDQSIVKDGELPDGWGLLIKAANRLRMKHRAVAHDPEPMSLDFIAGLTAAVQRTAAREPFHRDARTVLTDKGWRCQSCGSMAPCPPHQPRSTFLGNFND